MLSVQFGGERPSRQPGIETVLGQPGGELPIAVEGVPQPSVADDVVNGPELVVRATDGRVESWVATISISVRWADFEDPLQPY